jgi:2,4-dienoyl-CoA reductase-like NADH-dependent reductase (Old Yellow Enzyme family)
MIPGLKRLADAVHRGGAKISLQLVHAGVQSRYHNPLGTVLPAVSKLDTLKTPHFQMTDGDIETLVSEYAAAALRVKEAGFDAVQLHAAHGYGISQFLSPVYNKRTDCWGGSAENRRRFLIEVVRRVREATGPGFPLLVKLGVQDDEEGGLSIEEGTGTAREAEKEGINAIEVSAGVGGTPVRIIRRSAPEDAYFRGRAAAVRKAVNVPVIAVGGIRSLEMAEDIVRSGDADLISMCRVFIRQPDIIARWRRGETEPATCIHCNKCFSLLSRGGTLECGEDIHQRRRAERGF